MSFPQHENGGPALRHQPLPVCTKEEDRLKPVALLLPLLLGKKI